MRHLRVPSHNLRSPQNSRIRLHAPLLTRVVDETAAADAAIPSDAMMHQVQHQKRHQLMVIKNPTWLMLRPALNRSSGLTTRTEKRLTSLMATNLPSAR